MEVNSLGAAPHDSVFIARSDTSDDAFIPLLYARPERPAVWLESYGHYV